LNFIIWSKSHFQFFKKVSTISILNVCVKIILYHSLLIGKKFDHSPDRLVYLYNNIYTNNDQFLKSVFDLKPLFIF